MAFEISLPRTQLFDIPRAAGLRLQCHEGCLWITLDGDSRDIVLQPGESFVVAEPRRALIYALEPSRLGVVRPGAASAHASSRPAPTAPRAAVLQPC